MKIKLIKMVINFGINLFMTVVGIGAGYLIKCALL